MAATTPNETNDAPTADGDETSRSKKIFILWGGGVGLGLDPIRVRPILRTKIWGRK